MFYVHEEKSRQGNQDFNYTILVVKSRLITEILEKKNYVSFFPTDSPINRRKCSY